MPGPSGNTAGMEESSPSVTVWPGCDGMPRARGDGGAYTEQGCGSAWCFVSFSLSVLMGCLLTGGTIENKKSVEPSPFSSLNVCYPGLPAGQEQYFVLRTWHSQMHPRSSSTTNVCHSCDYSYLFSILILFSAKGLKLWKSKSLRIPV